jgi:hypothetical protein
MSSALSFSSTRLFGAMSLEHSSTVFCNSANLNKNQSRLAVVQTEAQKKYSGIFINNKLYWMIKEKDPSCIYSSVAIDFGKKFRINSCVQFVSTGSATDISNKHTMYQSQNVSFHNFLQSQHVNVE